MNPTARLLSRDGKQSPSRRTSCPSNRYHDLHHAKVRSCNQFRSSAAWFGKGHSEKCSAVHSLAIAGSESIPLPVEDSDRCAVYVDCAGQGLVALPGAGERHYVPIHCSWHQGHIGGALCSCCCLCLDVFGWKIYALGYIVSRLLIILFRMCACVHYLRYRSITKELRLHSHTFHTQ